MLVQRCSCSLLVHQFTVAAGLDSQHTKARFVAVERDTLDEAGDLLWLDCYRWLWLLIGHRGKRL